MSKLNGAARTARINKIAKDMVESDEDLRRGHTFQFLPAERPRVTKEARMDNRYAPVYGRLNAQGQIDRRYKSITANSAAYLLSL